MPPTSGKWGARPRVALLPGQAAWLAMAALVASLAASACGSGTGSVDGDASHDATPPDMWPRADQRADAGGVSDGRDAGEEDDAGGPTGCGSEALALYEARAGDPRVILAGTTLYYSGGNLHIVDLSDPTEPNALAVWGGIGPPMHLGGSTLYAGLDDEGEAVTFAVVDVADPMSVSVIGSVYLPECVLEDVFAGGALAYAACGIYGLHVLDVSDPAAPVETGSVADMYAFRVQAQDGVAYVADYGEVGVQMVDVADPASPSLLGQFESDGGVKDIEISGERAYLAASPELEILDISEPGAPTLLGSIPDLPGSWALSLAGDRAYVAAAGGFDGVYVVDIADFDPPYLLGSYVTPPGKPAFAVAPGGGLLVVGVWTVGFEVFASCEGG